MNKPPVDFFTKEAAQNYDERNSSLANISDCLHFLMGLVLKELPARSRILCVGVGTGAEIFALANKFPEWTFVGLDPSLSMLEVCRERIEKAGLGSRCEFVHGYVQDLPMQPPFDAVLSVLVGHFVKRDERLSFYQNMSDRLQSGGYLVNAEISFDLDSVEFSSMLGNWESVQKLMRGSEEPIANLEQQLREMLTILPPVETEDLIRQSGLAVPVRFFQALMICAWYSRKA